MTPFHFKRVILRANTGDTSKTRFYRVLTPDIKEPTSSDPQTCRGRWPIKASSSCSNSKREVTYANLQGLASSSKARKE